MYYVYTIGGNKMTIEGDGKSITRIRFGVHVGDGERKRNYIMDQARDELEEYFEGRRLSFNVPLNPLGTPWEQTIWTALKEIPYGETRSYREIAKETGNGKACQAVGHASGKNPVAVIIPCHRVIGSDGTLKSYASGQEMKDYLLTLEKKVKEKKN